VRSLSKNQPKILFISAHWEKGGAEKVFRTTMEICSARFQVDYFVPQSEPSLLKKIKVFKPDIIHIHNYHSLAIFLVLMWFRLVGRKMTIVYTAHDHRFLCPESYYGRYEKKKFIPYQKPPSDWERIWHNHSNKNGFINVTKKIKWFFWFRLIRIHRLIDLIFTPSNYLKEQFEMDKAFKGYPVKLLRNPFIFSDHYAADQSLANHLRLVFIGRLSFEKGILELLAFLGSLDKNEYSFTLDIIGEGKLKPEVEQLIKTSGLEYDVRLIGYVTPGRVLDILSGYDVMVFPSIWNENAPLVLMEGRLSGLMLLSSNLGGSREMAELCGHSFLFDPDDAQSFQKAFHQVYEAWKKNRIPDTDTIEGLKQLFSGETYLDTFEEEIMKLTNSK